jgi:hypothetical protein
MRFAGATSQLQPLGAFETTDIDCSSSWRTPPRELSLINVSPRKGTGKLRGVRTIR